MGRAKLYLSICTSQCLHRVCMSCHIPCDQWLHASCSIYLVSSESTASFYALCTISISNTVFKSHIRCGVWSFVSAPSECLTPYVMSHSMSNLKLHASCTISMSNTVCHVSYSLWNASCVMHNLNANTVWHISYSLWNAYLFVRHAPSQCLTPYFISHISCRIWSFMHHTPPQYLTPTVCDVS